MYAGGAEHPLKHPCIRVLDLANLSPSRFTTDAEVLQEILHRYIAIRRWSLGRELLGEFASVLVGRIHPLFGSDVLLAATLADEYSNLSARDLVHVAVMRRIGISRIVSTDSKFDRIDGIERLDPMRVDEWAKSFTDSA